MYWSRRATTPFCVCMKYMYMHCTCEGTCISLKQQPLLDDCQLPGEPANEIHFCLYFCVFEYNYFF